ncbi:MAG: hypothetical protein P0120_02710 [Nitrospira sp.]|nr:hypothetical protein [Nitrospira sp.]
MKAVGVSLKEAARAIGINVSTLRRDIIAGCPTVELGEVGRGRGSRVDLEEVRRWRARKRGDALAVLEFSLIQVFKSGLSEKIKLEPGKLAYILLKTYEQAHEHVNNEPLIDLPMEMMQLCAIILDWLESGNFLNQEK